MHPEFIVNPAYCQVAYTYAETKFTNDSGIETSAITNTDADFSIFYAADLSPVLPTPQPQQVTITATSISMYVTDPATVKTINDSFVINFESPCDLERLVAISSTT